MNNYVTPNDPRLSVSGDAARIQQAVELAVSNGCRQVIIPRINEPENRNYWLIDGPILLPDDFTVILDNARLIQADGARCNIFRNAHMYTDRSHIRQHGIRIIGQGDAILDGGNSNGICQANHNQNGLPDIRCNNMILMHNVENFEVRNIEVRNQRWWALNFLFCSHGIIRDIHSFADGKLQNQDGINLRLGCHHITISGITGASGDDLIALTAICRSDMAFRPPEAELDIHDITIQDVLGTSFRQAVIALRAEDEANVYNVSIENVIESNGADLNNLPYTVIRVGQNKYFDRHVGICRNIRVKNIRARRGFAVSLGGILLDAAFEGILSAGGDRVITTLDANTPDGGITMKNVTFRDIQASPALLGPPIDLSPMLSTDTLAGVRIEGLCYQGPHPKIRIREGIPRDITLEGEPL